MRTLLVGLVMAQMALPMATGYERYREHTRYDGHFTKYSKRYFGVAFDWRYFKAQGVAESNLRPRVQSPAGATGIMQIMPATYEEIVSHNPSIAGGINEPRWNIAAGIWYNRQLYKAWTADRPFEEQLKFMFGSYNAGRRSVLRAQRVAIDEGLPGTVWESIEQALPQVTGRRAGETVAYVSRIFDIKQALR